MIRASFGKTVARSMLIGGLALLAVPAVAGCEAGNNAPTLEFHEAASGGYDNSTPIHISNAFVLGAPAGKTIPAGGAASLFLGLFNTGTSADKLVSVKAVTLTPAGQSTGQPVSASVTGGGIALPPSTLTRLTGPKPSLVLKGLKAPLQSGSTVGIVLQFANAGSVTVKAPVQAQDSYYSTYSPPAAGTSKASPLASPTASGTATPKAGAQPSATPTASASATPAKKK